MPTRQDVYAAIDTEREYQESLTRNKIKDQSIMEHLATIEVLCSSMKSTWYLEPGYPSSDLMRKIAAVAVRCLEQHGVEPRVIP